MKTNSKKENKMSAATNLKKRGIKFDVQKISKSNLEIYLKPNAEWIGRMYSNNQEDIEYREQLEPELVETIKAGKSIPLHPMHYDVDLKFYAIK